MFDTKYRPLPHVIAVKCDYPHLPYRFRQKVKDLQYEVLELRRISRNKYLRVYLFDDACMLLDILNNKILWTYDYLSSMAVLKCLIAEIKRFFVYENTGYNPQNFIQINDYKSLKKKFYET